MSTRIICASALELLPASTILHFSGTIFFGIVPLVAIVTLMYICSKGFVGVVKVLRAS